MEQQITYSTNNNNMETRTSNDLKEISSALSKAQGEFPKINKNRENPYFKSKYADLENIIKATTPALSKNGLSVLQLVNGSDPVKLTTLLTHSSGEFIETTISHTPQKKDIQSLGSVITYLRRYTLQSILNVSADDDSDGNDAVEKLNETFKLEEVKEKPIEEIKKEISTMGSVNALNIYFQKNLSEPQKTNEEIVKMFKDKKATLGKGKNDK